MAQHNITVNAVAPGRIATDRLTQLDKANAEKQGKPVEEVRAAAQSRIPAGRYGMVEEYAAAAVFLASERRELHDRPRSCASTAGKSRAIEGGGRAFGRRLGGGPSGR